MAGCASLPLLLLLFCVSFSVADKRWTNVKFAVTLFQDWDRRVYPVPPEQEQVTVNQYGPTGDKMRLSFNGFAKTWNLELQQNKVLFSKKFTVDHITATGRVTKQGRVEANCWYVGQASAGPNEVGYASVSTCGGKLQGYIITNHNDYALNPYISPLVHQRRRRDERALFNATRRESRQKRYPKVDHNYVNGKWNAVHFQPLHQPAGRDLNIELGIVVEKTFKAAFENEISRTPAELYRYLAQIAQNVQLWYIHPTLGYRFWITIAKIVITEGEWEPKEQPGFKRSLGGVCGWHIKNIPGAKNWGAAAFISEDLSYFNGGSGLGQMRGMCDKEGQHCVGIGKVGFHASELTRTIAHEIGHLLGMEDAYYRPMQLLCFSGMMRQGVYEDHDWDTCGVQLMENFIHVSEKKCVRTATGLNTNQKPPTIPGNVAWRAKATQSSTYHNERGWGAWKATDGAVVGLSPKDTNATLASCTQTLEEQGPWLLIDLSLQYSRKAIQSIHIYNREDCCDERLRNFEIRVGNSENFKRNPLCHYHNGGVPGGKYGMIAIKCDRPLSGRYVSIQIKGRGILTVCEVQVFQDGNLAPFNLERETCLDELDYCMTQRQSKTGICDPIYAGWSSENCRYTCGYCQRKSLHTPVTLKAGDTSPTTTLKPGCKDYNDYCFHYKGMGKCGQPSTQEQCPKSCGIC